MASLESELSHEYEKGFPPVKIYSSIACFRNVCLVGAGESLLVTNPSVKVPRADPRAMTGKQTAIPYPGAVHLFRHTSPATFLPRVICSSLSRRREQAALASFRAQKLTGAKERIGFSDS